MQTQNIQEQYMIRDEDTTNRTFLELTVGFDLTVTATVKQLGVVGPGTATSSVSVQSFKRKPVWISTATSLSVTRTFDTWFHWATDIMAWVKVFVSVFVIVDTVTRQEQSCQTLNKLPFNSARSNSARICVQFSARSSKIPM